MRTLGEEIAVLDGLEGLGTLSAAPADGRIGRRPASGAEYAKRRAHNYETRRNVIDASEGANYSGGSSYAAGLPLMPSSVGLAEADLINYSKVTNVLPTRKNVIDPSGGANYSGGSSYTPGMPLVVSGDPGLADAAMLEAGIPTIHGGYGRPGLGQSLIGGGYGRAGLGYWEEKYSDFDGYDLGAIDQNFGSTISIEDGRIGRRAASGAEYAKRRASNYETRRNVIDASEGANYSGGSSYAPGLPLMPSSIGLAGLGMVDGLDAVPDAAFFTKLAPSQRYAFKRVAGKKKLDAIKKQAAKIARAYPSMTPRQQMIAKKKLGMLGSQLNRVRSIRRGVTRSLLARRLPAARQAAAGVVQQFITA